MKKFLIFFFLAVIVLSSVPAWADSAHSESNVTASAHLTYAPHNNYEAQQDKRFHMIIPYGVHLINPAQPPLPPRGWLVVRDPALEKTFNRIELGKPSRKFFKSWEDPIVFARYSKPIPGVKFLKAVPTNRYEMGEFKLRGADIVGDGEPIFLALQRLKYETGTKWFYILKNYTGKAKNAGVSLGSGGIFGRAIGPAKETDKSMVAFSAGGILGKSSAWVEQPCNVWIRAYSKSTAPENPAANYAGSPIFFEFNKYQIKKSIKVDGVMSSNSQAINSVAAWTAKNLKSLKKAKQFVSFYGYCDIRGGEQYNDWLGNERAKVVMLAVVKKLAEKYKIQPKELNGLFMYSSAGKRQPQFKDNDLNRRVDVVYGKYITTPPANLPGIMVPNKKPDEKGEKNEK